MRRFTSWSMFVPLTLVGLLVPLYAHHGMQFLSNAMEMNQAEIRISDLAAKKAQNPRVKQYAQMLVKDHTQSLEKIRQLRDARLADAASAKTPGNADVKTFNDVQLNTQHQRALDKLSGLSGADFDREYIIIMVRDHQSAVRAFEAQTRAHGNGTPAAKQSSNTSTTTTREKPGRADHPYSHADYARDTDTADFANATLPTLKHHLEQAQSIQMELATK